MKLGLLSEFQSGLHHVVELCPLFTILPSLPTFSAAREFFDFVILGTRLLGQRHNLQPLLWHFRATHPVPNAGIKEAGALHRPPSA